MTTTKPTQRWAFGMLLALVAVALGVSGAPAPLYALYAQEWGFEPITTTVVFAVYAVAALGSVLVTGSISDRYGRRPVLIAAVLLIRMTGNIGDLALFNVDVDIAGLSFDMVYLAVDGLTLLIGWLAARLILRV